MNLLNKTRALNSQLHQATGEKTQSSALLNTLRDIILADAYLLDSDGNVEVSSLFSSNLISDKQQTLERDKQLKDFRAKYLNNISTIANISEINPFAIGNEPVNMIFVPVYGNSERIGTLFLSHQHETFQQEDIALAEYSAALIGLDKNRESSLLSNQRNRERTIISNALSSLSYSEIEAIGHIFSELDGREGLLVASRIADRVGITRSVIVNALRKLESAGVVEARSLGMKGTHIRITSDSFLPAFEKLMEK